MSDGISLEQFLSPEEVAVLIRNFRRNFPTASSEDIRFVIEKVTKMASDGALAELLCYGRAEVYGITPERDDIIIGAPKLAM